MDRALSIRLGNELHVAVDLLARCHGRSIAEEVREAVRAHLEQQKADPTLGRRLNEMLERDRDAAERLIAG